MLTVEAYGAQNTLNSSCVTGSGGIIISSSDSPALPRTYRIPHIDILYMYVRWNMHMASSYVTESAWPYIVPFLADAMTKSPKRRCTRYVQNYVYVHLYYAHVWSPSSHRHDFFERRKSEHLVEAPRQWIQGSRKLAWISFGCTYSQCIATHAHSVQRRMLMRPFYY